MYSSIQEKELNDFIVKEETYKEFNKMNLQKTALSNPNQFIELYQAFVINYATLLSNDQIDQAIYSYAEALGYGGNYKELYAQIVKDSIPILFDFVAAYNVIEEAKNKMKVVNTNTVV